MNHPSVFPINQDSLKIAANILLEGGVVCMPTDTFYGLAGIATNETAVEKFSTLNKDLQILITYFYRKTRRFDKFVHSNNLLKTYEKSQTHFGQAP